MVQGESVISGGPPALILREPLPQLDGHSIDHLVATVKTHRVVKAARLHISPYISHTLFSRDGRPHFDDYSGSIWTENTIQSVGSLGIAIDRPIPTGLDTTTSLFQAMLRHCLEEREHAGIIALEARQSITVERAIKTLRLGCGRLRPILDGAPISDRPALYHILCEIATLHTAGSADVDTSDCPSIALDDNSRYMSPGRTLFKGAVKRGGTRVGVYVGHMLDGLFSGLGVMVYHDQDWFVGSWKRGEPQHGIYHC